MTQVPNLSAYRIHPLRSHNAEEFTIWAVGGLLKAVERATKESFESQLELYNAKSPG